MEWEVHTAPMPGFGDHVGLVEHRMGCNLQPGDHTRSMEHGRERKHINVLELTAAYFALKAFTKDKPDMHVHLRVDNHATQAHINKMGGPGPRAFWK